ncbi:MAG: DUF348 domain-containing protein [Candidatus Moranbacteria bacterium]|nr:DUF348 domain-containing protein [Candidatus Moranbacteria bacterium]
MRRRFFIPVLLIGGAIGAVFLLSHGKNRIYDPSRSKDVTIILDGFPMTFERVTAETIGSLVDTSIDGLSPDDTVIPSRETPLSSGMRVTVSRRKELRVTADGETKDLSTDARSVGGALIEAGISLREDDLADPAEETLLVGRRAKLTVIRVEVREESADKKIAYETKTKEDDSLSWRKKVVETKGENGVRTYRYRVSYHDGKEVSRKLLGTEVTKEPVAEVVVQGTYVKVGKADKGLGTWYSYTGKLAAASLSLPLGSYARVTNPANGKSVIVVINDRGPYGKGRIIDLDKVAFEKIASLGSGVIEVKVEPVLN